MRLEHLCILMILNDMSSDITNQMVTILDVMGEASAQAQGLKNPITR